MAKRAKARKRGKGTLATSIAIIVVAVALLMGLWNATNSGSNQTLSEFLSSNPNVSLDAFSNFIEPRLDNVSMFNVSYLTSGYAIINGNRTGKNFSLRIQKYFDNYSTYDTDLGVNKNSTLLQLSIPNQSSDNTTFLCSQTPIPITLPNGTVIAKRSFICQHRSGISAEDSAYAPFEDSLGLSSLNTTTEGGLYNTTVISRNFSYLGDSCTLIRSNYVVSTSYNISSASRAKYVASGMLTQCISNHYFIVLFGKFVGRSDVLYPKFANGTMSTFNVSNAYTFYQINATALNARVSSQHFTSLPGPIADYPQNLTR
ncbi:MAG: hypothetical protein KGH59_02110 [Candidatus Micrarchaeota archaeon]|nr:hypothetical protein [Candidatus Micrarchaeota archaeon]